MLSPSEFETYLRIAREQRVFAFRLGELSVQFEPVLDPGPSPLVEQPTHDVSGSWKRPADLDIDKETEWD